MNQPANPLSIPNKPCFISLEGGEGSGKSSLLSRLQSWFIQREIPFIVTREPGGSRLGEEIRKTLLAHRQEVALGSLAEFLLFLAARAQHIEEVIRPSLLMGKVVLTDRFNDSSVAYQGVARGLGFEYTQQLCDLVCYGLQPDITLLLDVDPVEGLQRAQKQRGKSDRIEAETLAFHEKVRAGFLQIAGRYPQRVHVIDARQSLDTVFAQALAHIEKFLFI